MNDPHSQSEQGDLIDLSFFFGAVRRRWALILAGAAAVLLMALTYVLLVEERYTAHALILFEPQGHQLQPGQRTSNIPRSQIESEIEIARSEPVVDKVILDLGLIERPEGRPSPSLLSRFFTPDVSEQEVDELISGVRGHVRAMLSVRQIGLSSVLEFSAETQSPAYSAELANAFATAYLQLQIEAKVQAAISTLRVIEEASAVALRDLEDTETVLGSYLIDRAEDISTLTGNSSVIQLSNMISQQRSSLTNLSDSADRLNALLDSGEFSLSDEDFALLNSESVLSELQIRAFRQLRAQRQRLLNRRADDLSAEEVQAQLTQIEAQLEELAKEGLNEAQTSFSVKQRQLSELNSELELEVFALDLPPEIAAELFSLQSAAQASRRQYSNLLDQIEAYSISARTQVADSRLFSQASPPLSPSFPRTSRILMIALVLGVMLFTGVAILLEIYFGGFSSGRQLGAYLRVQNVIETPKISDRDNIVDLALFQPFAPIVEKMRVLRAVLELGRLEIDQESKAGYAVACFSSLPAEGKTTTSLGLSMVSAAAGMRVCLLDLDFRRPKIAARANILADDSLIRYLKTGGEAPTIHKLGEDQLEVPLHIISTVHDESAVADQLFFGTHFKALMDKLKLEYDLVVIDTSPVLYVAASRYLQQVTDRAIFCVKWETTNKRFVEDAFTALGLKNVHLAEPIVVLSQVGPSGANYYANYSYYSPEQPPARS